MRSFIAILICIFLAGCVSQAERAAAFNAQQDATCRSYGTTPGTDAYVQCRVALNGQEQQRRTAILGMAIQNNQAMAAQQQRALQNVVQPVPQQSAPVNCTTSYVGNQAYTQCR